MNLLLSKGQILQRNQFVGADVAVCNGCIVGISPSTPQIDDIFVYNLNEYVIFPGFVDVHVHLREPGFFYKETIHSGTMAAAHGGYTTVCSMPNVNPCPDCIENLGVQTEIIKNSANVHVCPYGTITKGQNGRELSDFARLADKVIAFSDDGRGVQDGDTMLSAMKQAKKYNKIIVAHCEDNALLSGGYIHAGEYAARHGHRGISSESEWRQIKRDLSLAKQTGCSYHVCHISTKESVDLIRRAKAEGVDVTCKTAPHYLVLNDMDLQEDGRFKMNPPIRSEADRQALLAGICDGTIDIIATDHAPHSEEEKSKGLEHSAMGIVGLETAFSILYTKLVKQKIISLEKLFDLLNTNPRKRFSIGTSLEQGQPADITIFDLNEKYIIHPNEFLSKGKSSPFSGMEVFGKCKMTMVKGRIVWQENLTGK